MLKKSKIFMVLAIVLTLCFASTSVVFAAGPGLDKNGALNGTEQDPAQASITKIFQMPIGTDTPAATFSFKAEIQSVDEDSSSAATAMAPVFTDLTVSFAANEAGTLDTTTNIITLKKETGDILGGADWPHAGVYVYKITESVADSYQAADPNHESLTYSGGEYTLTVYVVNGTNGLYVATITDTVAVPDNSDQTAGDKVDPTPGGNDETGTGFSDMVFTNTYVKTNGSEDPKDPDPTDNNDSTLSISKTVTGALGDKNKLFDFSITLTPPSLLADVPDFYNAYVVDTTVTPNTVSPTPIEVSTSAATPFQLKDGQKLVFVDTPVGTSYTVTETGADQYTPSYIITTKNVAEASVTGNVGQDLSISPVKFVGEAVKDAEANKAAFTNNRDMTAPTGITMNNLPFVVLIALVIGAIVAFIAVKSRKRAGYYR